MKEYGAALLQALVAIVWADETLRERKLEVIDALGGAFELTGEEGAALREYAQTPRSLDELPLTELSAEDRRLLVMQAVLLSYADGDPAPSQLQLIDELVERLRIPEADAAPLLAAAHGHARRHSSLARGTARFDASRRGPGA